MKKIVTVAMATTMVMSSMATTFAITSLTDVPDNWATDNIKFVFEQGLMTGTSDTTFAPTNTMTRAEFITVMVRAMYPEVENEPATTVWYEKYVNKAIEEGLITASKYTNDKLTEGMPRQEMAWMMMNYIEANESTSYELVNTWQIADYDSIGNQYQSDVRVAFSLGLLKGTDSIGTFNPQGTMTRQEAATVINRMVDASIREPQGPEKQPQEEGAITITEGEVSVRRNAQAGDTFIKADGTSIILTVGPNGVVGEGQGVAPDLGMLPFDYSVKGLENQMQMSSAGLGYKDSLGNTVNNAKYQVNQITGEGHWLLEWQAIEGKAPTSNGSFEYQLSSDYNWVWVSGSWQSVSNLDMHAEGIALVKTANGLS